MTDQKKLIVITGPTACGKTATAIKLANYLKTAIVSADSRQFYREMSIGTAKPDAQELASATHYFINSHTVTEPFSVGDYEKECLACLSKLFKDHDTVILTGGSGLFIRAVTNGFDDLPPSNPVIRGGLNTELLEKGIGFLQERLKNADPEYYAKADIANPQRIIRALEVFTSTGMPFSSYLSANTFKRPFSVITVGLDLPREELYMRINQRVDKMMADGLLDEARSLLPYRHLTALNTVGYNELFDHFDGKTDLETAVALIKQNTRRYAKRQLTWFRKDPAIYWMNATDPDLVKRITEIAGLYN